ncbi:uncharacterized protein LOC142750558 [Rhinoderma darwinii]|uniref:uncharacterized protein LOC142750558 n=1 Tax=Rhinoderma darwinii TaxID=43563 RepID=UPI003F6777E9
MNYCINAAWHGGDQPVALLRRTSTSAPVAEAPMVCPDASRSIRAGREMLSRRGATPVRVERMLPFLRGYPNRKVADLLWLGFSEGFRIPCTSVGRDGVVRNLSSALARPDLVTDKLLKEVALGRMAGPFSSPPVQNLRVSPLGLVPKKEVNKFRLIHHLSYPEGESVNDGIDPALCAVSYTNFDAAVVWVRKYGKGSLLAKTDIEAAFRLLPVHPDSFCLLGCYWQEEYFVDCCLPMGCSISCAYFEMFSTFLEWVVRREAQVQSALHYLDDFLFIGPPGTYVCAGLLHTMERVARDFGVPLAPEKTEGPMTVIKFLGIMIDSDNMECRLPDDKLLEMRELVVSALRRKKIQLRDLQSLLGHLNFACRIMPMGRVFCRRLASATAGVHSPHHFIRLSAELKADLLVWGEFLQTYNGRSVLMYQPVSSVDLELYTDASGACGFGAYFQGQWCAGVWPDTWHECGFVRNLALLELFPIVVAAELWGDCLRDRRVRFVCDNLGVVQAVNAQTANSPPVVRLLRHLVLRGLMLNAHFVAVHIPGVLNSVADSLSRQQWDRFRLLAPGAESHGLPCPEHLWKVV